VYGTDRRSSNDAPALDRRGHPNFGRSSLAYIDRSRAANGIRIGAVQGLTFVLTKEPSPIRQIDCRLIIASPLFS
jgi:hypothetical protein